MKPDGVATAALEPMEGLDSNPVNEEAAPPMGEMANQAASPLEEVAEQQPMGEIGQGEPLQEPAKESPAAKAGSKASADSKAKPTNKAPAKTKPGTGPAKTAPGSRPNTAQSRITNGVSKPQTNGVAKKSSITGAPDKKGPPASKKPPGLTTAPSSKTPTKVGEKKPAGINRPSTGPATNGVKSTTATTVAKKTQPAPAKKPAAPTKPATAAPTKPGIGSPKPDRPPVSKTTRPTTGTAASRPASASTRAPAAKSSTPTAKPTTPKTPSTTPKPAASKTSPTTPSAAKTPAIQASKPTTPIKKDVPKPTTPALKKAAASPLTRPSPTAKSTKPETPKSASKPDSTATKKPVPSKATDTKTTARPKTQENKATPSKTPSSKTAATKSSSPKKTVGSSTPTPVKRAPKAVTLAPPPATKESEEKEVAAATVAAVAAAATVATVATVISRPEEPEAPAEAPPVQEIELLSTRTEEDSALSPEPVPEPVLETISEPTSEPVREPSPALLREQSPEPMKEPSPEFLREPSPEPVREPSPAALREPSPEPLREPSPEPLREPSPEPVREPSPVLLREPSPEPMKEPSPEFLREPSPEPVREPSPELLREPSPEPLRETSPELLREPSPEPLREPSPDLFRQPTPELVREPTPEPDEELFSGSRLEQESFCIPQLSAQLNLVHHGEPASDSVPSLGTTVMSPPCSPPGAMSPAREPQSASPLLEMHVQPDPWAHSQPLAPSDMASESPFKEEIRFHTEEEEEEEEQDEEDEDQEERVNEEEEEEEEEKNLFIPTSTAPSADAFLSGASPMDNFTSGSHLSPQEKEEAVEKAEEEINDDDDEDEEDEEQRRLGHQPSSMFTDMSGSQPSEELPVRSSDFGGWHGDDLLSGMDSEDVSSSGSSRLPGLSDLSSTQHTALLEGTQSSDALVDSSLRGSEGDGNFMGSPNVETLANEEEDEDDEEEERVDDMDVSSERAEEHHKVFLPQGPDEEEEDEDVEMPSEGVTESGLESCENADEDDFNEDERLDNLNRSGPQPAWGHTNPFSDPWAQPASQLCASSPSPVSDYGAGDSETPTQSPAQAWLDSSAPCLVPQAGQSQEHRFAETASSFPEEGAAAAAVSMSQSGTALAAHSGSETSTPDELPDYDSSSGVESRSDKQHTPVPASVQPDMDLDLGIHLEKGDGEEEEAETLPADEVLGAGPPTAPASAPSSPSTSGDEASDTEGEMQINDPDAPITMDDRAEFDSPPPAHSLPALQEYEEAADAPTAEGDEDGGSATPQSANSVASYGFDCTTSNSNAHSVAESCGKSPGIFSLENEDQLTEEAKDPSLIKELTLPSAAAAQAEDLLGRPVDLMPLGQRRESQSSLDDDHYMLGGKMAADGQEEVDPLEPGHHLGAQHADSDSQPPYYSAICDKTDSFLAGDHKSDDDADDADDVAWSDGDEKQQNDSREDNQNQNPSAAVPIANGHYLALVPGNRRPIDATLAAHFAATLAPPPPSSAAAAEEGGGGEQMRRLEKHQEQLRAAQERQKKEWLEEERLRAEQQRQLERQRRELLQLQQQEHRHRRQVLQWQLELEHQYRLQQKHMQHQQQQMRRSPTGVMLSPSSGLCTIYEAMETSEEEEEEEDDGRRQNRNAEKGTEAPGVPETPGVATLRPVPPQDLDWNKKVDMVQQLINQTLLLSGDGGCPPLLLLPVGTGGTLSPLESSRWSSMLPQFSSPSATVTSVSSYSPDSQGSSSPGDWTVVEVETQH